MLVAFGTPDWFPGDEPCALPHAPSVPQRALPPPQHRKSRERPRLWLGVIYRGRWGRAGNCLVYLLGFETPPNSSVSKEASIGRFPKIKKVKGVWLQKKLEEKMVLFVGQLIYYCCCFITLGLLKVGKVVFFFTYFCFLPLLPYHLRGKTIFSETDRICSWLHSCHVCLGNWGFV